MLVLSLLMAAKFRLMSESILQLPNLILQITEVLVEFLLFLLQLLSVKFLALTRVESVPMLMRDAQKDIGEAIRSLPVSQKSLLLLQFLLLLLISRLENQ